MNIKEDNTLKLNKYNDYPPNPSYIAGFIDGDGTIFIRKIKDGYQSGISISQSRTNILQILQYHYGGIITKPSNIYNEDIFNEDGYYDKNNKRNSYTLIFRSNEYKFLLKDIKDHIILKKIQIDALNDLSILVNKTELNDEKDVLRKIDYETNSLRLLSNSSSFGTPDLPVTRYTFNKAGLIGVNLNYQLNKKSKVKGFFFLNTDKLSLGNQINTQFDYKTDQH